jgi:ATP synthase protein I
MFPMFPGAAAITGSVSLSEHKPPPSLEDLKTRLDRARDAESDRAGRASDGKGMGAIGVAMQMSIEVVAPLGVGVFIGWLIDGWLVTAPLFLVIFFFLGAAAGGLNVYRRAGRLLGGDAQEPGGDNDAGRDE